MQKTKMLCAGPRITLTYGQRSINLHTNKAK